MWCNSQALAGIQLHESSLYSADAVHCMRKSKELYAREVRLGNAPYNSMYYRVQVNTQHFEQTTKATKKEIKNRKSIK